MVSPMAKRPTRTTTSSIPSSSSGEPNVSRVWPVWASMPMTPRASPRNRDTKPRTREGQHGGGGRAGDARADGGGGEGRRAAAAAGHAVALVRRHDRAALPGRVQQDRRRGSPVHRSVEDAGEHDEGPGGVHLRRHRKEEGDRERGADAWQDPDRRAENRADERPEEVQGRQGHDEAVGELMEGCHAQATPNSGNPGSARPRRREKRSQQATPRRRPTPRSRRSRRDPEARAVRANVSAAAIGKPRGRMTNTGSVAAATVVQSA